MTQIPVPPPSQENSLSDPLVGMGRSPDDLADSPSLTVSEAQRLLEASVPVRRRPLMGKTGNSLARQLLQTVIPLTIAPLVLASTVGYWITQSQTQTELRRELGSKSLLTGEIASQEVADTFTLLTNLSNNPAILNQLRAAEQEVETEGLTRLPITDLEAEFKQVKLLKPSQELNDYLRRAAELDGVQEIVLTEKNGFNIAFSVISTDFVQSDEAWWQKARAEIRAVGDLTYDESVGTIGFNVSQRIDDKEGNFLGVSKILVNAFKFSEISDFLRNSGIRGSQQVQLLDTSSETVMASYSKAGGIVPRGRNEKLDLTGGKVVADLATRLVDLNQNQRPSIDEMQKQFQSAFGVQNVTVLATQRVDAERGVREDLTALFIYNGKQYAVSTMLGVDWVAIASMDTSEIQTASLGLLNVFGLIALALGGIAAIVTIGLSRRLSSPLNDLSDKARQVSAGNLEVNAEPKGSSETQTLAQTFNTLVYQVRGFLQEQTLYARRANLIAEITSAKVLSSEELLPVFEKLTEEARNILETDRVVIYLFNQDWSGTIVTESVGDRLPSALQQKLDDPCIPPDTREKYAADGLLLLDEVSTASLHPEHLALLQNLKVKSIMGVPILAQGKLYGLLITHHCRTTHRWQPAEVDFFRQLGVQAGQVIDRVQLLEQTKTLAEEQRQIKEGLQQNALQLLMDVDPVMQGDLTARAKVTEDEIGTVADSYNATVASLRKIVVQVQDAAHQVANTTDTNDISVRSLSTAAAQQAQEILTALERVQEMANSVQIVASSAKKAEFAVQQAAATVEQGDAAMNRTVDGILQIRTTVAETAKKVKRLGESSQKISNVVNLISGFAAQTNMLALNAAIEASRAGEEGKGFAVVAEEVRELARQSAEATTEIEKLVASIQTETNEVVTAMEAGTEQVVLGTQLVDETRQSLNQINATSRQIGDLVQSIAQATIMQTRTSETVTDTMNTVAAIANQNSSAAQQVSESFEQLRQVAQALQAEVGRFKVS